MLLLMAVTSDQKPALTTWASLRFIDCVVNLFLATRYSMSSALNNSVAPQMLAGLTSDVRKITIIVRLPELAGIILTIGSAAYLGDAVGQNGCSGMAIWMAVTIC